MKTNPSTRPTATRPRGGAAGFIVAVVFIFGLLAPGTSTATGSAIPTNWEPTGAGGGGALFVPSFSPFGPELYVCSDMSELFHSANLGASWEVVDFRQIQGGSAARVAFTSNPQVRFVINMANDSGTPAKSTDGGRTWAPLDADPTGGGAFALYADPARENRILLTDYENLYCSGDGGASFKAVYNFPNGGNGLFIGGAFFDGQTIIVGSSAGVLVSTNGGGSFVKSTVGGMGSGEEIVALAGAKQGATTRLLAITVPAGNLYPGLAMKDLTGLDQPAKVYTIDWGAGAWTAKSTGIDSADRVYFAGMAGNNISTAWLAGGVYGSDWPAIYKTTDAGAHWTAALTTDNNQNIQTGWEGTGGDRGFGYGGGISGFGVNPADASQAAFTDDGYSHLTTNGGALWRQAYLAPADQNPAGSPTPTGKAYRSNGLEDTSCWRVTWSDANNVWASFTDIRGIRSADGGRSWSFNYTGHTENTAYDCVRAASGTLYMATSSVHDMYQSTYLTDARIDGGSGRVLCSTDQGKTWQVLHNFSHPVVALALDPNAPNTLYASVVHSTLGGIFKSTNIQLGAASTWTRLPTPPRTQGHPFGIVVLKDGTLACTYSGRRDSSGKFTDSSGVFVMNPGDTAWTDRSDANMHYWVKDLVIDSNDGAQNTWYCGVWSGWGGPYDTNNDAGGLYRTTDRGRSWTRILQLHRASSCAIDPGDGGSMFVTTETDGLWHCADLGSATPHFTQIDGYPFRQPERVAFNPFKKGEV